VQVALGAPPDGKKHFQNRVTALLIIRKNYNCFNQVQESF